MPSHLGELTPFLAMDVMERAGALEALGHDVVHLAVGEPDFAPPPAAIEACRDALLRGRTRYTDSRGLRSLREAIAADKTARGGGSVDPDRVIVTSGTSPALLMVFRLLLAPGDEVLIPTPHYPCYPNFVRACGGTPVFVPCDPGAGWAVDLDAAKALLSPRTRAVVVGSPANPTGAVVPRAQLEALASLGVPVVSDEIYDGLVYDGAEVASAVALDRDAFVLDGFSKRYAMTGFRLGYVIAPEASVRPLQCLQQNLFISASEFVQHAGLAALQHGAATVEAARACYAERRRELVDGLRALGFGVPSEPRGAFYVFADASRHTEDSLAFAMRVLEDAHVAIGPGIDFGDAGEGWVRLSFSSARIAEGLERLARVL